ncbi:MAG: hypothetical protein MPN21_20995, partial [Thermoanaerobaculia bacterium]|nr:hypothetical protein [Thermoanaerobaculia bacterium]
MRSVDRNDPEIVIRCEFEREDNEDSQSLRWSLLGALALHALALTLTLPAVEETNDSLVVACSYVPSKAVFARSVSRTVPEIVPAPVVPRFCGPVAPLRERSQKPLLVAEPELDLEPLPLREPQLSAHDLGITPRLTECVEPQWAEIEFPVSGRSLPRPLSAVL